MCVESERVEGGEGSVVLVVLQPVLVRSSRRRSWTVLHREAAGHGRVGAQGDVRVRVVGQGGREGAVGASQSGAWLVHPVAETKREGELGLIMSWVNIDLWHLVLIVFTWRIQMMVMMGRVQEWLLLLH